jgi:SAM-dependent methyltransferase
MPADRDALDDLIHRIGRSMVEAGIDEHDEELIRLAAEGVAHLIEVAPAPGPSAPTVPSPDESAPYVARAGTETKNAYTKEEIDRLNRAAEKYFQEMKDPSFVLNKPMSAILDAPLLLYRFSVLLASMDIGFHTVLDFGAGSCWVSSLLNRMGCRTIALDVSETALRLGRRLFELDRRHRMDLKPQFLVFDGYTFPLQDGSIDRIICFDAFHHVPNRDDVLREMYRVLKEGGSVGFSEPGVGHSKTPMSKYEMDTHGVLESDVDLEEFIGMVREVGFDDVLIKPYPPPERIAFSVPEYRSFLNGDDRLFPLDVVREDLKHSTNVIAQKGKARCDTRRPRVLKALLRVAGTSLHGLRCGERYTLYVSATNLGDTVWLARPNLVGGYVTVGARLYDAMKQPVDMEYGRTNLPADVLPDEIRVVALPLIAPPAPGVYYVELDMVCEMICWFGQRGSDTLWQMIEVG